MLKDVAKILMERLSLYLFGFSSSMSVTAARLGLLVRLLRLRGTEQSKPSKVGNFEGIGPCLLASLPN
jgi:hypothetical protein